MHLKGLLGESFKRLFTSFLLVYSIIYNLYTFSKQTVVFLSEVLCIRISKELKRKMKELNEVNWRDEIVSFLTERVKYYERLRVIREVRRVIESIPEAEPGTAVKYVRGDRDSN